jgi:hypothetical protein
MTDATFPRSTILSADDPRIIGLEYKVGDKFCLQVEDFREYQPELASLLENKRIIIEVEGYMLFAEGDLGYMLKFIEPDYLWHWGLRHTEVEESCLYLGENFEEARFIFIND